VKCGSDVLGRLAIRCVWGCSPCHRDTYSCAAAKPYAVLAVAPHVERLGDHDARVGGRTGVAPCHPHRFLRTLALWCLRDGMEPHSLRLLMGHSSLAILQRCLALAGEDIYRTHKQHSPVDNLS